MRVIFEEVDKEYFFEIVLSRNDLEQFQILGGLMGDFIWESTEIKNINVYIRKEKETEYKFNKMALKRKRGKCVLSGLKNGN